jgi:hypothetical protein
MTDAYYVYAIVAGGSAAPAGLEGFDGRPIGIVDHEELAAATSSVDPAGLQPTAKAVLTHEAVVERLRESMPLLPVRFGTVFADAAGIVAVLSRQYETLLADLKRLGETVEFGLTVLWPEPPDDREASEPAASQMAQPITGSDSVGPGTEYLRARVSEQKRDSALRARAQALWDLLETDLGPYSLDCRRTILPTPRIAVRAAYLLHPSSIGAYQEAFERSRKRHPGIRFLLNGPWPPYSFVSITGSNRESSPARELRSTGQGVQEEVVHGTSEG